MAIEMISKMKPKNGGTFPLMDAQDIEMPDGSRLSELAMGALPLEESAAEQLQPDVYRVFGEVSSITVELVEMDDGKAHEYCFEFVPTEDFSGMTVTPAPAWVSEPQFPAGKTCQVSILRGIGVMVCA